MKKLECLPYLKHQFLHAGYITKNQCMSIFVVVDFSVQKMFYVFLQDFHVYFMFCCWNSVQIRYQYAAHFV